MKRSLMDLLACPIDKSPNLELIVFDEKEEVVEGMIVCQQCTRWYPIIDEIPHMLPDELRDASEDLNFLEKHKGSVPEKILKEGKPFNLSQRGRA